MNNPQAMIQMEAHPSVAIYEPTMRKVIIDVDLGDSSAEPHEVLFEALVNLAKVCAASISVPIGAVVQDLSDQLEYEDEESEPYVGRCLACQDGDHLECVRRHGGQVRQEARPDCSCLCKGGQVAVDDRE